MARYRDLSADWKKHLKTFADELGDDVEVVFYSDDGTDGPDVWEDGPHLAVDLDPKLIARNDDANPVWPVDFEGWASAREIGWEGILRLLSEGLRE
jgi:hypothetical protein